METAQHWDRLAKNQPAEIAMFQISLVQESPDFNGRRSFLTLRHFNSLSAKARSCDPIAQRDGGRFVDADPMRAMRTSTLSPTR